MSSSLSNLVTNLPEVIYKIKFTHGHCHKKCEFCGIKYKNFKSFHKYTSITNNLIEYKCLCRYKHYQKVLMRI